MMFYTDTLDYAAGPAYIIVSGTAPYIRQRSTRTTIYTSGFSSPLRPAATSKTAAKAVARLPRSQKNTPWYGMYATRDLASEPFVEQNTDKRPCVLRSKGAVLDRVRRKRRRFLQRLKST